MPMVGKKKFPYTKKGKAEAKKYKDKNKKKMSDGFQSLLMKG
jgi:hypothetical protein